MPCATLAALATVTTAYSVPLAAYHTRFPTLGGLDQGFVAATDTIVRSFMGTFSTLAKRYHVYMIGSTDVGIANRSRPTRPRMRSARARASSTSAAGSRIPKLPP